MSATRARPRQTTRNLREVSAGTNMPLGNFNSPYAKGTYHHVPCPLHGPRPRILCAFRSRGCEALGRIRAPRQFLVLRLKGLIWEPSGLLISSSAESRSPSPELAALLLLRPRRQSEGQVIPSLAIRIVCVKTASASCEQSEDAMQTSPTSECLLRPTPQIP